MLQYIGLVAIVTMCTACASDFNRLSLDSEVEKHEVHARESYSSHASAKTRTPLGIDACGMWIGMRQISQYDSEHATDECDRIHGFLLQFASPDQANKCAVLGLSAGLLTSIACDIDGISIASASNGAEEVNGLLVAGLFSFVERSNGVLLSGLVNHASQSINGVSIAGFSVTFGENLRGFAATLGVSSALGNSDGVRLAGLTSGCLGSSRGVSIAGLVQVVGADCIGLNVGGIHVEAGRDLLGINLSMLSVEVGRHLDGFTVSPFISAQRGGTPSTVVVGSESDSSRSSSVSISLINYGFDEVSGLSIAGLHLRSAELEGVGIGGWVRSDAQNNGVTIGLLNECDVMSGNSLQIGLVNHVASNPAWARWLPFVNWNMQ